MKRLLPLLLALASPAAAATTVALRPEARVADVYVAMAYVAEIRGDGVPAVWLGKAPPKGETILSGPSRGPGSSRRRLRSCSARPT